MTATRNYRLLRVALPRTPVTAAWRTRRRPPGGRPGRSAGWWPGSCPGSPGMPGHLPPRTGTGAQVSGGMYLRG